MMSRYKSGVHPRGSMKYINKVAGILTIVFFITVLLGIWIDEYRFQFILTGIFCFIMGLIMYTKEE